jgi:transcriptional regulator with XRE-family HTH domain
MQNNEDILIKIGERLRELRKAKGYSSYENFAFDHDIPRMQYWRLEKGKTNVTIRTLEKVLKIYNISFKEFFDFEKNIT